MKTLLQADEKVRIDCFSFDRIDMVFLKSQATEEKYRKNVEDLQSRLKSV